MFCGLKSDAYNSRIGSGLHLLCLKFLDQCLRQKSHAQAVQENDNQFYWFYLLLLVA